MNKGFFNILDFNASPDGLTDNTDCFKRAIEDCSNKGGGTVTVPPGRFFTGAIHLKSNIELHLCAGAEILFSSLPDDYPVTKTRWEGTECYALSPMVYGAKLVNVSITGRGVLDGRGGFWWNYYKAIRNNNPDRKEFASMQVLSDLNKEVIKKAGSGGGGIETNFLRPPLVQFNDCSNVTISGITVRNSAFWNTHILYCSDVTIRNVRFSNPSDSPNTDGLDIDSSDNVRISDCFFDVGDDCLALKSGMDEDGRRVGRPTENVTITNCIMRKGHGAVVFGSECAGGIRNVVVSNCIFIDTDRGIRVKSRRKRGGFIENIHVSNIIMENVICPIVLNLYYRCGIKPEEREYANSKKREAVNEGTPFIRNINVSGISSIRTKSACGVFFGLPEKPIEGIVVRDSYFEMVGQSEPVAPAMDFEDTKAIRRGFFGYNLKDCKLSHIDVKGVEGKVIDFKKSSGTRSWGIYAKR